MKPHVWQAMRVAGGEAIRATAFLLVGAATGGLGLYLLVRWISFWAIPSAIGILVAVIFTSFFVEDLKFRRRL